MSTRRRASARHKNPMGGIPLPAERNEIYGENDEIVPIQNRDSAPITEEDDDALVLAQHDMLRAGATFAEIRNAVNRNNVSEDAAGGATGTAPGNGTNSGSRNGRNNAVDNAPGNAAGTMAGGNQGGDYLSLDSPRQYSPEDAPPSYFDPNHPPFTDNGGNGEPPGVSRTSLLNPFRTPYNSGRDPSEPSTLGAKYGMAGGRIPTVPLSSRSFNHENDLYENADVRTPVSPPISKRPRGELQLIPFPPMRRREVSPNADPQSRPQAQGSWARSQLNQAQQPTRPVSEGIDLPLGQGGRPVRHVPEELYSPPRRPSMGGPKSGPSASTQKTDSRQTQTPPPSPPASTRRRRCTIAGLLSGLKNLLAFTRRENMNASASTTPGREEPDPSPQPVAPGDRTTRPRPINEGPKDRNGSVSGSVVTGSGRPPRPRPPRQPEATPADSSWSEVWAAVCDDLASLWKYSSLLLLLIPLLYLAYTNVGKDLGLPRVPGADFSGLRKYIPSPVPFQLRYGSQLDKIRDRLERLEEDVRGLLIREGSKSVGNGGPVSVIAVDKDKNGRLVVPSAFYEALKDRISRDQKWIKEVVDRGLPAIDDHLLASDTLSRAWDSWVLHNKKKVVQTLGPEVEREVTKMTQKEVNAYLKKHRDKFGPDKSLVSQDDFGKLVQKEIKTGLARELKDTANQVGELDKKLKKYIDNPPQGMTIMQVTALVEKIVNKYRNNLNSGAAANAGLKGHFANYQANNVNFFSVGSGAVVDPTMSSPKWKIPKYTFKSKKWYDRDGYKPQPLIVAITPWAEEGECFCAGPNIRGEGVGTANVSVLISRDVVPRYLVVEHILPGATLDAAATPKDIEVWGSFMDLNLRKTVLGWSESRFPEAVHERALHTGFVKLGEFEYESVSSGDGVQVFSLSDELLDMNAAANHFVIRAMNNQGGADHTCFYRLRLYGDVRERDLGF